MGWFLQGHLEFLDKEILDGRLTWSVIGIQPQVYFSTVSRNKLDLSFFNVPLLLGLPLGSTGM